MNIYSLHKQGLSQRTIARKLGISRNTVSKYLERGEMPEAKSPERHSKLEPFYQMIKDWLSQENYQATRIHELLLAQGFTGSYDVTLRYVRKLKQERDRVAYTRFETVPGYQAQVDFADFKVKNPDGSEETLYCFSMVLGFSRHMYVELVEDCKMSTFLDCQISFNNNRYVVPHHYVGQRVLVKYKHLVVKIFHDEELLASYTEPQGKGNLVQNPDFYEALKADTEQLKRKYALALGKGKATRVVPVSPAMVYETVYHRDLSVYEQIAEGISCLN